MRRNYGEEKAKAITILAYRTPASGTRVVNGPGSYRAAAKKGCPFPSTKTMILFGGNCGGTYPARTAREKRIQSKGRDSIRRHDGAHPHRHAGFRGIPFPD